MDKIELERRTKKFALRTISFVKNLPKSRVADVLGFQLLKSGTSIGANYREANRAESYDDFIHKIGIVEKEASESQYWLELMDEDSIGESDQRRWLLRESDELIAIFTTIGKSAKAKRRSVRSRKSENSQSAVPNPQFAIRNSK